MKQKLKNYKKKIMLIILTIMLITIISPITFSAIIKGYIYNNDLTIANNTIISINTSPEQRLVAKNGTYYFKIPIGKYLLKTNYLFNNKTYSNKEIIIIKKDEEYRLDIILFPELDEIENLEKNKRFEEDINLLNNEEIDNITKELSLEKKEKTTISSVIYRSGLSLLIILLIYIIISLFFIKKEFLKTKIIINKEEKKKEEDKENKKKKKSLENNILEIIEKEEIITQKELRKKIPFSEAKISLAISALEKEGKIKKIKKGRSNIIRLNK